LNDNGARQSPAATISRSEDISGSGDRLLKAHELAALLGFSAATIVDWAAAGQLPCFKVGGRLRFRLGEVETWLEAQRRGPRP
jgi:excisionase family DNA binding protein